MRVVWVSASLIRGYTLPAGTLLMDRNTDEVMRILSVMDMDDEAVERSYKVEVLGEAMTVDTGLAT